MMKIGIMGGTFNPIHNVHLLMAEEAARQFELDEVWFMPSKNPPHKKESDIVSAEHRTWNFAARELRTRVIRWKS